jgi:hypothetical protein
MQIGKDPPKHLEAGSLAPAVGLAAAFVCARVFQGQAEDTGQNVTTE